MPDIFFSLTVNELNALYAHHQKQQAWERECAAFSGYCAGAAFAAAWNGKLDTFDAFYHVPDTSEQAETTSDEYIERYNSWT